MGLHMEPASGISSEGLAELIVDALIHAGVVEMHDLKRAIEIATEEIDARKAVRDYWCTECVHNRTGNS